MSDTGRIEVHRGNSFGDLIVQALSRYPERIAVRHGRDAITYRELQTRISQVCQALESMGLSKGDSIAHLTLNRPEEFYVAAASYILGLRYVPLHPMGSITDFQFIITHSQSTLVVIDLVAFGEMALELQTVLPTTHQVVGHRDLGDTPGLCDLADQFEEAELDVQSSESDIARIAYTGGTTGRPKGVMQSHRSLVTNALLSLAELEWPEEIRFLCCTPLSHANAYLIVPVLLRGGTFILHEKFAPESFLSSVHTYRITSTLLVPTMLYTLLDSAAIEQYDHSSLELIIYGAAPTTTARLQEAIARFGPVLQQTYGLTESPNCIASLRRNEHTTDDALLSSCGVPYIGSKVALLDEDCRPVEKGEVGEVCLRGPLVMDGYWQDPIETDRAFAGGWFHTGDMAYANESGHLFLVDRKNDLIISGGFNVYAREVEDAISGLEAVANCAVVGVPDSKWGEAVKAFVTLRPDAQLTELEVQTFVRGLKGAVHSPKSVEFLDVLPVTPLGKLDKKALRSQYWESSAREVN
jgi:fatty-acyl-CoA synthase